MKRRALGIVLALILATLGTVMLVAYANSAKNNASKNEEQVKVYVVKKDIRQGAPSSEIKQLISLTDIPKRLVAAGAVTDLTQINDSFVAGVNLTAGEQLLGSRLVDARTLVRVAVPTGLQEITVGLSPERAVGANLSPGDTVGIVMSYDRFNIASNAQPAPAAGVVETTIPQQFVSTTHLTLHKVLVTSVQLSQADSQRASQINGTKTDTASSTPIAPTVNEAPAGQLLITFAVSASQVEQIVYAAEFGHIWLTSEGANASEAGTRILTLDQAYVTVGS